MTIPKHFDYTLGNKILEVFMEQLQGPSSSRQVHGGSHKSASILKDGAPHYP